jgi:ribosome biogenesis GTPase / thiamine phosphate phosphatase
MMGAGPGADDCSAPNGPQWEEKELDLLEYGFSPALLPENTTGTVARIIAVHRERFVLVCRYGECCGRLKAGRYHWGETKDYPTAGDFVLLEYNAYGDSQILATLPRRSKFARNDFSGHAAGYVKTVLEQVVAANFDYVFIMASLNQDLSIRRIERYVALAWQSGAMPVVILTKADLVEDAAELIQAVQTVAPGVGVHAVSVRTQEGLAGLADYLQPRKTIVFLGSSGVGKSSLVNALAGEELMTVRAIREDDSKGRHTTTHRQLILLKSGVMVIDTPGMRELGLWELDSGLGETFGDVERYLGQCRFADCRHQTEPGCAIKAALASGELLEARWTSYLNLQREARFARNKSGKAMQKPRRTQGDHGAIR